MALTLRERFSFRRFTQGEPPHHHTIKLNHRRIFILPSKAGLALAVVILLMLFTAINYNNSMAFVFTFLLAACAQVSTLSSYKNLSSLDLTLTKTGPFFAKSVNELSFLVKELKGRERWAITASYDKQAFTFNLEPDQTKTIKLPFTALKRGWYQPNTLTFSTRFPFGIFRAWSPLLFKQSILIYPKAINSVFSRPVMNDDDKQGEFTSEQSGADDFIGLKPYQAGHPYRHINWKAFAAQKGMYSNQFSSQSSAEYWLDWNDINHLDKEARISQLCYWVLESEQQGVHYGLRIPSTEIPPGQGSAHQHLCLKALALA